MIRKYSKCFREGIVEILCGILSWRVVYLLGSAEIRRRYARSRLGPLWVMISSVITTSSMGFVWAYLWKQPVSETLPYVSISMVVWSFFPGCLNDATTIVTSNNGYLLNQKFSISILILSSIYKNLINFLLNLIFPLILSVIMGGYVGINYLHIVPAIMIVLVAMFLTSYGVAIVCTRFRDVTQLLVNFLQVLIYATPVLWKPELFDLRLHELIYLNPAASFLAIIRDPLLGRQFDLFAWGISILYDILFIIFIVPFIGRYHKRLIFWV